MWQITLHEPMFLPDKEFVIKVDIEPTEQEAETARQKFMAKRYEITKLSELASI